MFLLLNSLFHSWNTEQKQKILFENFYTNIYVQNGIGVHDRGSRKQLRLLKENMLTGKACGSRDHDYTFGETEVNHEENAVIIFVLTRQRDP
jgi:hypothetical protein